MALYSLIETTHSLTHWLTAWL